MIPLDITLFPKKQLNAEMLSEGVKSEKNNEKSIEKIIENFSASCFGVLLNNVFQDLHSEGGYGEQVWREFLTEEYGKVLSKSSISDSFKNSLRSQLLRLQEGSSNENNR